MSQQKSILIAPLNWGLGHATRCIPIIQYLLSCNCNVVIAASGQVADLLKQEFPSLQIIHLQSYTIHYSRYRRWLPFKLALQLPKLLLTVYKEQQWLKKVLKKNHFDAVISDNRFGLYSKLVPSVYITHQLQIQTGTSIGNALVRRIHGSIIKRYQHCWVPDWEIAPGLAGVLSHLPVTPGNVSYLGPLSRFKKEMPTHSFTPSILIALSGPEPQRTLLENKLLAQLGTLSQPIVLIRGLPGADQLPTELLALQQQMGNRLQIYQHIPAAQLQQLMQQALLVICRSGYTSIMDLVQLGKKALLIPTPGQTEQEYLAQQLQAQEWFYWVDQSKINLAIDVARAIDFGNALPEYAMEQYQQVLQQFVQSI